MAQTRLGPRGLSDENVRAKTGKSSKEWYAILDRWGAPKKGHTAAARYLAEAFDLGPWWSQAVSIRYEYERGLRSGVVTVPPDLRRALARSAKARAAFEGLALSHRREYVEWIEDAKRPETRARRVADSLVLLVAGKREPR